MNIEHLCRICRQTSAPYKCPKCQIKYCSLACYRHPSHETCSIEFDQDEIIDSMNGEDTMNSATTTNNFVRERIADILKRKFDERDLQNNEDDSQMDEFFEHLLPPTDSNVYRDGPSDDESSDDDEGEQRIVDDEEPMPDLPDDIDESEENVDQLWDYLTDDEKREFEAMLGDGRISHLLNDYKPWKPWWLYKTQAPPLVTDLEASPTPSPSLPDTIPAIVSDIVPLPSLTSILPHVHVRFDLFEILFAYVLISVRYRGDFNSYVVEAGTELLHVASRHFVQSPIISNDEQDPIAVLHARISLLREHLQQKNMSLRISEEFFVNLLADLLAILHGPYPQRKHSSVYVLAALSDLKRFLLQISEYKPTEPSEQPPKKETIPISNVFHINRKINSKVAVNRTDDTKLRDRPSIIRRLPVSTIASHPVKKSNKSNIFNRKIVQSLSRKIDYLLSWTESHGNRLLMLEFECEQVENDLRQELIRYQEEKDRIEKNLKHIRLHQQTTQTSSNRIQEL